jgi:hypothetical protein
MNDVLKRYLGKKILSKTKIRIPNITDKEKLKCSRVRPGG